MDPAKKFRAGAIFLQRLSSLLEDNPGQFAIEINYTYRVAVNNANGKEDVYGFVNVHPLLNGERIFHLGSEYTILPMASVDFGACSVEIKDFPYHIFAGDRYGNSLYRGRRLYLRHSHGLSKCGAFADSASSKEAIPIWEYENMWADRSRKLKDALEVAEKASATS